MEISDYERIGRNPEACPDRFPAIKRTEQSGIHTVGSGPDRKPERFELLVGLAAPRDPEIDPPCDPEKFQPRQIKCRRVVGEAYHELSAQGRGACGENGRPPGRMDDAGERQRAEPHRPLERMARPMQVLVERPLDFLASEKMDPRHHPARSCSMMRL